MATTPDGAELVTLDLDLQGLKRTDQEDGTIVASGITATLSKDAAAALNNGSGIPLPAGACVGSFRCVGFWSPTR